MYKFDMEKQIKIECLPAEFLHFISFHLKFTLLQGRFFAFHLMRAIEETLLKRKHWKWGIYYDIFCIGCYGE